jgi:hypothetical protein
MKKVIAFIFGMAFFIPHYNAFAQTWNSADSSPVQLPRLTQYTTPSSSPTPSYNPAAFSPEHLKGYFGMGLGSMTYGGTALVFRYWMDNSTALDIMAGGGDNPTTGYDFSGNAIALSNFGFGVGLCLKENLSEPVRDVFVQMIERVTYSQNYIQTTGTTSQNGYIYGTSNNVSQNQQINLFWGLGFEAFIPFWRNLSIEGSVGLSANATFNQASSIYNPTYTTQPNTQTSSGLITGGASSNTFSLVNGSVHFYF